VNEKKRPPRRGEGRRGMKRYGRRRIINIRTSW
jgi:hypothetical protein